MSAPESICGPGSSAANTARIRKNLPALLTRLGVTSLIDAGCGDQRWIRQITLPCAYSGYDHAPRAEGVTSFDITTQVLPRADAILCRHVLNHCGHDGARDAIQNFKASGSTYLIANSYPGVRPNKPWKKGGWKNFDLDMFSPGTLLEVIPDCDEGGALHVWRLG